MAGHGEEKKKGGDVMIHKGRDTQRARHLLYLIVYIIEKNKELRRPNSDVCVCAVLRTMLATPVPVPLARPNKHNTQKQRPSLLPWDIKLVTLRCKLKSRPGLALGPRRPRQTKGLAGGETVVTKRRVTNAG